jgi:hypothetical protein
MSQSEHERKTPGTTAGRFALLAAFLGTRGTGAPLTLSNGHGARSRRRVFALLAAVAGVLGVLVFGVSVAAALQTHVSLGSFGPDGTEATVFARPAAVALDQGTGNVYVADPFASHTVSKFDLEHKPEPFGGISPEIVDGELTGFDYEGGELAVNSATHDLYFDASSAVVKAYQSDGEAALFTAGASAGTNEIAGSEICGVAVDSRGDIYVSEFTGGVRVFAATGAPLATIPSSGTCQVAVDSNGVVYLAALASGNPELAGPVEKFTPSNVPPVTGSTTWEAAGTVDETPAFAVAVDPQNNHLYADEGAQVAEYDATGVRLGTFGAGVLSEPGRSGVGLAVNGISGLVYVGQGNFEGRVEVFGAAVVEPDVSTGVAEEIEPAGEATLTGTVNPDGIEVTECVFEYGTSTEYGHSAPCAQAVGAGTSPVAVSAHLTGLEPGVTYHYRLTAANTNAANHGEDATLETLARPAIHGETAADITRETATLEGDVNPQGTLPVEECRFDWGTSTTYEHHEPCEQTVGSGTSDVLVSLKLTELQANRTYHWRLIARNAAGTTESPDHTFVYDTEGEKLPDNRAYEMVSPTHKNAALLESGAFATEPAIAEDGERVVTATIQCFDGSESCGADRGFRGAPFLFSRTPTGWTTTPLSPPASQFLPSTLQSYSAEPAEAIFTIATSPMFEADFYVRRPDGSFVDLGPLTPPSSGPIEKIEGFEASTSWASAGVSRIVFQEEGYWPFAAGTGASVYRYTAPQGSSPEPVAVSGGAGNGEFIDKCETTLGGSAGAGVWPGEVSTDGTVVYFTAKPCASGTGLNEHIPVPVNELFVRVGDRTDALSEPQAPELAGSPHPFSNCASAECVKNTESPPLPATNSSWRTAAFVGASSDGAVAFFTSAQQLTDEASEESNNLYESECRAPCAEPASERHLIDVSEGAKEHGGPRVNGVVGLSADGSHVYFVAGGVLATANAQGHAPTDGANNLYVYERDASHPSGQISFIADLPQADQEQWNTNGELGSANVTPDGRYLVFESHGDLTPDVTRTDGATQIYRYDALTDALARISIGNDGFNDNGNAGTGDAAIVPAGAGESAGVGAVRLDPTMSHDGRYVFFTSPIGLTPHALNDVPVSSSQLAENVYEWHEGHVYLISDGRDTTAALGKSAVKLIGSDATGTNVFFTTADQLVSSDTDTQLDYYDARICTSANPCISAPTPPLPPCNEEACHGTPAGTPAPPDAPTLTFAGPGNPAAPPPPPAGHRVAPSSRAQLLTRALKACRGKHNRRKRVACERAARHQYGAHAAKTVTRRKGKS